MSTPMSMTAGDASVALDHEALAYFAGRRREQWRRRLLPALGLIGLIVLWWALVEGFDVKPFIAPSPQLVAQTMVAKWSVLWQNLIPTAIEALGGFLMGSLVANWGWGFAGQIQISLLSLISAIVVFGLRPSEFSK